MQRNILQTASPSPVENLPSWWKSADQNDELREGLYYALAAIYGVVGIIALIQLIRIIRRVPEYGWTTQKIFHLLNSIVCGLRCVTFAIIKIIGSQLHQVYIRALIFDIPGLLFFTTYSLLVLFWAEIYYQARSKPTSMLKPAYFIVNFFAYAIEIALLIASGFVEKALLSKISSVFMVFVFALAGVGFCIYGGRLFIMLNSFPLETAGRKRKVREVGSVTITCTIAFILRAVVLCLSIFYNNGEIKLDIFFHPVMNFGYYILFEILPTILVLIILRKLPPKRLPEGYQTISSENSNQAKI
eukprot:TRINITY_DN12293_c0_g1_i3.p1 TRINITY_DN12293_c0_g1~~TRINITY_DN12293_c0_g1_i3.p1  ORF type:complete len:336 (-),score=9.22 TRINITY_DN12293_c0_g1_i3:167-1069(-)